MQDPINISSSEDEMEIESDEEYENLTPEEKKAKAEELKAQGNSFYSQKRYDDAIQYYTKAIDLCPDCAAYYGNRSATYMMIYRYDKALEDARKATSVDHSFVKGHLREAKCHLAMGEFAASVMAYQTALQLDPNNTTAATELNQLKEAQNYGQQAESAFESRDYRKVVFCIDQCLRLAPSCKKLKILRAECLALLKRYQEAQEVANDMLRLESANADAVYVRGLCLYYQDNIDKAFQHFQQVLRLAPDHTKARDIYKKAKSLIKKKEEGNNAFRSAKFQEAYSLYTEALEIDPLNIFTNSKLYCNRATVSTKLNKLQDAIKDCTEAIKLDDTYIKAYLRRAKCYNDSEQYEEAVRDYEAVYKMDKSKENKKFVQDAKLELKKSKRKDYYKILGVQKQANEDEIKKAYKKRALQHHPDRHASATDEEKKEQEKKFKEIGEAYTVLSDKKKKMRYDQGHDLEDLDGMGGFSGAEMDPNQIFASFFGGGGGFGGGGFGGGGSPFGFQQQQQGGFPGGFSFQFG